MGGGVRRKKARKHGKVSAVHSMYWYENDLIRHSATHNECIREKQINATAIEFAHTDEEQYLNALLRGECISVHSSTQMTCKMVLVSQCALFVRRSGVLSVCLVCPVWDHSGSQKLNLNLLLRRAKDRADLEAPGGSGMRGYTEMPVV